MWRRDEDLDIVEPKICYNDSQLDSVFDNGIVSSTESLFITQTFKDIKAYQDARNSLSYIYSSLYLTSKLKNDTRISQISFDSKYPYRYCIQVNCKSLYSKIIKNTIFECVVLLNLGIKIYTIIFVSFTSRHFPYRSTLTSHLLRQSVYLKY